MEKKNFRSTLIVDRSPDEVFGILLDVRGWWSGLFGETFTGPSEKVNDVFEFRAGDGLHYSRQKMVECIPGKSVAWKVTESSLSFLADKAEWTGTTIRFDIGQESGKTRIDFTHDGLVPEMECYTSCAPAWTQYIQERLLYRISKSE